MRTVRALLAIAVVLSGIAVIGCNREKNVAPPPEKKLPAAPNASDKSL